MIRRAVSAAAEAAASEAASCSLCIGLASAGGSVVAMSISIFVILLLKVLVWPPAGRRTPGMYEYIRRFGKRSGFMRWICPSHRNPCSFRIGFTVGFTVTSNLQKGELHCNVSAVVWQQQYGRRAHSCGNMLVLMTATSRQPLACLILVGLALLWFFLWGVKLK